MELEIDKHMKEMKDISKKALEESISELEDPVRQWP